MKHSKQFIGIDLGGTHLRFGLYDLKKKQLILRHKTVVGQTRSEKAITDLLVKSAKHLTHQAGLKNIPPVGIGVPGIISNGIIFQSPHYSRWKNFDLARLLQTKLLTPVVLDNDANMIARGEFVLGAATDWPDFLMVTLGTGIGGALVIQGKPYHGTRGFAGEFGHVVVEPQGPICPCGGQGCMEIYASASGLRRAVKGEKKLASLLNEEPSQLVALLSQQADKKNAGALRLFDDFGKYLGIGLASIVSATGVERILLGGGITQASRHFLKTTKEELQRRIYRKTFQGIKIRKSKLGDDAGLIGAAHSLTDF